MSSQFIIPDLLVTWPWQRVSNPMWREIDAEANEWVQSFGLFEPAQFEKFKMCDFSMFLIILLSSRLIRNRL